MSYDNLSSVSQNVLKFHQQLTGEERRIPFIFDDFHFCRSRIIGLDMTENRIFTLCRMITWLVFHRMFWNFISSLPVKRGESLSFLVGTVSNVLVMEIGWTDVGSGGYILVSYVHSNTSLFLLLLIFSNLLSCYFFFYYLCLTGVVLYANIVMYATNVVKIFLAVYSISNRIFLISK
jgi:hypothetical protein